MGGLITLNHHEDVHGLFQRGVQLMSITKSAAFLLAWPLLVVSLIYGAIVLYPKATARPNLAPEDSHGLLNQSRNLLSDHKYDQALLPSQKLYEANPGNPVYIEQMAEIYDLLHRYKEETEFWERFRQYAPQPNAACPKIGQAYQKQGLSKKAISAFQWCLSLNPTNPDSIFNLALSFERDSQFDRAAEWYERGSTLAPDYADLQIGLARVQTHLGKFSEAEKTAGKVLERAPANTDALFALGMAYYRGGDLVQARTYFERGVKGADSNPDFHLFLGQLAEKERKITEAIVHYDRAVELKPDSQDIRKHRDELKAM